MIRIVVLAAILAAGFLALGYLLIPRGAEQALISLKSQDIDEAAVQYEIRYAAGDRSVGTLSALAGIYERRGDIQEALQIASELSFAYADPNLALRRKAEILQAGQFFGRAAETLQEISPAARTVAELRWLIGQYGLHGRLDPLTENLQALVDRAAANQDEVVELARVLAARKQLDAAIAVLDREDSRPDMVLPALGQAMLLRLLIAQGHTDRALTRAESWIQEDRLPVNLIVFAAEQMRAGGSPEAAVALLQPLQDRAAAEEQLQSALVDSWLADGHTATALAALQGWLRDGRLDPALQPRLLEIALQGGDYALARSLAAADDPGRLGTTALLDFVDAARLRGAVDDVRALQAALPADLPEREPLLAAAIAFALGDRERALADAGRAAAKLRGSGERQRLAALLAALDRPGTALAVLHDGANLSQMSQGYLTQLAALYLADGRTAEGLALFRDLQDGSDGTRAAPGWAVLAAAAGQAAEVQAWLARTPDLDAATLRDLNAAATAAGLPPLALETAARLNRLDPDADARLRLAIALRLSGRAAEARPILDALALTDPPVRAEWIAVLTALGDTAELRRFHAATLADPLTGPTEREQAVFDLIAVGGFAEAMDYLEQRAAAGGTADAENWLFAFADAATATGQTGRLAALLEHQLDDPGLSPTALDLRLSLLVERAPAAALAFLAPRAAKRGGILAAAYQELLRRSGDRDALAALLLEQGLSPRLPAEQRRQAAFGLLDLRDRTGAIRVFQALAEGGDAQGPDAQQLAYLWGPRPGGEALDWIQVQALAAQGARRIGWLALLARQGGGSRLIALVEAGQVSAAEAGNGYLDALMRAGRIIALRPAIAAALQRESGTEQLRTLAEIADRARLAELAELAWRKLAGLQPDDAQAIRQLAGHAARAGRYREARALMLRFLDLAPPTASDLYALAEIDRALDLDLAADDRYRQAAAMIDADPAPGFEDQVTRAQIAHRLGRSADALARFDRLHAERPDDPGLRNDFAELLLDLDEIGWARTLLR